MKSRDMLMGLVASTSLCFLYQVQSVQSAPPNLLQKKQSLAPTAAPASSTSQTLPIVKIPDKLSKADEKALNIVSEASIVPVAKGIFPNYRPRAHDEDKDPISAWTVKEYQAITRLRDVSEEWRQITTDQRMAMDSLLGGVNIHGVLTELKHRAEGIPANTTEIFINGDKVDSLLSATPTSWQSVIEQVRSIRGTEFKQFEVSKLKSSFGEDQTKQVLTVFANHEREKGRPHEVWVFGLTEDRWQDRLADLKKQLKPCGYEAFALEFEPKRSFFSTREEADLYAKKLNVGASPVVQEEGPAELIIDKAANVISTTGTVAKSELDPAAKKRIEELESEGKLIRQTMSLFGAGNAGYFSQGAHKFIGPRFQFTGYPRHWIPPQAKIEYQADNQIKITIPKRFSVSSKYREAFAIKDYDQYKYLVAQGLTAINYDMCGRDVIRQLRQWDGQYGLSVLQAHWDGVTAKLDKLPTDLQDFAKKEKQLCPAVGDGDLPSLKEHKIIEFWWD